MVSCDETLSSLDAACIGNISSEFSFNELINLPKLLFSYAVRERIGERTINIFEKNKEGRTIMHAAALNGDFELYKLLHKLGKFTLEYYLDDNNNTPLHFAASVTDLNLRENIENIFNYSIPLFNIKNKKGMTAAHIAATYGNPLICWVLYTQIKEKLFTTDNNGNTLMHYAVARDHPTTLNGILKNMGGTNYVNERNKHGKTILDLANKPTKKSMVKIILEAFNSTSNNVT